MAARPPSRRKHSTTIHITAAERDVLLAHVDAGVDLADLFASARTHGPLVCLDLDERALADFLDALRLTANSAQNVEVMELLGFAFERIECGLAGETDPGAHMLRPAISRMDMTPTQGQYLAFIHTYTRLHRRAPAESDLQEYFRTTPPSVHGMLKTLQKRGFISRTAGVGRSTRVLLAPHQIPELE